MKKSVNRIKRSSRIWMCCSFVLFFALFFFLLTGMASSSGNNEPITHETIAIVNGNEIGKERLYELLMDISGKQALEQLIVEELINQEAQKQEISITEADIDQELKKIKREYDTPEEYRNKLAEDGFTDRTIRAQTRTQLLLRALLGAKTNVSDTEVLHYYEQNIDRWSEPDAVRVSHILVQSRAQAEALVEELNNGADFTELAVKNSLDPGVESNHGDLGFIDRGYLEQSFEDAAFSQVEGQSAEIVETHQGFHILQVTDRKYGSTATFEEREEELRNELIDSEIYNLIGPWLEKLRAEASIELLQQQ